MNRKIIQLICISIVCFALAPNVHAKAQSFRVVLEEVWKPYLDGRGTRDEAFAKLIERTAIEPPQQQTVP